MKKNDYILAIKKVSKLLRNKQILSAYEYGSYKNPGLSDIDLFLIIEKKTKNSHIKKILNKIKKDLSFFFQYSTIMITNENFMKNIFLFDDLKLKKIFGKRIKINSYSSYTKELLILSVLEWLPERLLRFKESIDSYRNINLRKHLGLLNSIKYTLKKLDFFVKNIEIKKIIKNIDSIRKDKEILNKKGKILIFSKEILKISKKSMLQFSKNSQLKKLNTKIKGKLMLKFPSNYHIKFEKTLGVKREKKRSIRAPLIYSLPFAFHLKNNNNLGKILKNNFILMNNYNLEIQNKRINFILKMRNKMINENVELLLNNGIYKGLYKFGWFLKQSNIYKNN